MKRANGFSLLEMIIAMALGTLVLGAAVQIYSQGVAATVTKNWLPLVFGPALAIERVPT